MRLYITEQWLRDHYGLAEGTEVELPVNAVLTPSARDLIDMRLINVKYKDEQGQTFVETDHNGEQKGTHNLEEKPQMKRVHGLTSDDQHHIAHCVLCQQALERKPDTLTHLNGEALISKNDPRIKFRSEVDSAIALIIWIQTELDGVWPDMLCRWLSDLRSALGNIMKAEVTGAPMPAVAMGDLNEEAIHKLSHNPLKYLGYDHIVPEVKFGKIVAKLNLLRTKVREVETTAAALFIGRDFVVERPDIMQGLNRLSSAIYVLMILTIVSEREGGKMPEVKQ